MDKKIYDTTDKNQHKKAWVSLDKVNIAHKTAAVDAWNDGAAGYNDGNPLKETGKKSKEVNGFMKASPNYEIESGSINKSEGAQMKKTYDDPVTPKKPSKNNDKKEKNDTGKC